MWVTKYIHVKKLIPIKMNSGVTIIMETIQTSLPEGYETQPDKDGVFERIEYKRRGELITKITHKMKKVQRKRRKMGKMGHFGIVNKENNKDGK